MMIQAPTLRYLFFLLAALYGSIAPVGLRADDRAPVWAGKFYPGERLALARTIDQLTRQARAHQPPLPTDKRLKALILPHAGYAFSGPIAAQAWHGLNRERYGKVILMGPDHRVGFVDAAVSVATAWITPLGRVPLHADSRYLRRQHDGFRSVPESDQSEHSLEVILPFLQVYLTDFTLVPIVLGPCDHQAMARAIGPLLDEDALLVVSADLSHYLDYDLAVEKDRATIQAIIELNLQPLLADAGRSCGRYPIAVLLHLARKYGWQAVLLQYANSGDTTGDHNRVVGYAAIAFYGEKPMSSSASASSLLKEEQGHALVALARQTLREHFKRTIPRDLKENLETRLKDPVLQACCGTFVTLKIEGQLRGCIGSLVGHEPIVEGVRNNAVNAAFHDPRFRALTDRELDRVSIEVSILSTPEPLEYAGAHDLTAKLRPHVDGVTIRKGFASATFLPQVWEQLPDVQAFLSQLCLKAGLAGDAWRQGDLKVETYHVQHFEESD